MSLDYNVHTILLIYNYFLLYLQLKLWETINAKDLARKGGIGYDPVINITPDAIRE